MSNQPVSRRRRSSSRKQKSRRRTLTPRGPKSRDRHWLYQESVQSPDVHFGFFDRAYRRLNGSTPRVLKEDFCGTALLASEWVEWRRENTAIGVDLHAPTLAWGKKYNLARLTPEQRARVRLQRANVLHVTRPRADLVVALNFSYFIFRTRDALREYFRAARRSLAPGGMFIGDIFGGWDTQKPKTERTRHSGFTYLWEMDRFDPVTNFVRFHIHFEFRDRGGIRRAFTYDWRLWSIPEIREILHEAGFRHVDIYWEGIDRRSGHGNSVFRRAERGENAPGWIAFFVAYDGAKRR
ncbi:MAG TPA: class I SAM-dependent methyltransferase [Candidatus Krumholzibacteria bacterium]|nr:class I SAM-dependent methyltransferase [Candidatus Krumholzibacteria bacterium]